jgi:hypothetical protein
MSDKGVHITVRLYLFDVTMVLEAIECAFAPKVVIDLSMELIGRLLLIKAAPESSEQRMDPCVVKEWKWGKRCRLKEGIKNHCRNEDLLIRLGPSLLQTCHNLLASHMVIGIGHSSILQHKIAKGQ